MQKYIEGVFARITADVKEYGIAAAAVLIYAGIANLVFHAFCPLVIFCGLPCPGCGVSRAAACFLTGRWQLAWQMNPVIYPIALFAAYFCVMRYLLGRKVTGLKVLLAVIMVLLILVYGIRMYLYFPDRAPCVYTESNVLAGMVPFYQHILHDYGIVR